MEFVCIGLDIREWPAANDISADATVWPQVDSIYERAKVELGLKENRFQLLQVDSLMEVERLKRFVDKLPDAILIGLELPLSVFNACQQIGQFDCPIEISKLGWEEAGFDVCDLNGFFSILHMEVIENTKSNLFRRDELTDALVMSQVANIRVPSHSPFVLVSIRIAI